MSIMDIEQVMGPPHTAKELKKMAPKFIFDGENAGVFLRELSVAADFYGVAEAYHWEDNKELSKKEERQNVLAIAVLRQYVMEDVLQVITTGKAERASLMH